MKKIIVLFIIIITPLFFIIHSFRYKSYSHGYVFMLKENDKIYKIPNFIPLAKDRMSNKFYIELGTYRFSSYGNSLRYIFEIDSSNYKIEPSDSKYYDGIVAYPHRDLSPVKINSIKKETSIHDRYKIEEVFIDYNNEQLKLILDHKNIDLKYKSYRSWFCSKGYRKTSCGNPKKYAIEYDYIKDKFDLKFDIEIDDKNKIVYFIKK